MLILCPIAPEPAEMMGHKQVHPSLERITLLGVCANGHKMITGLSSIENPRKMCRKTLKCRFNFNSVN